MRVAVSIPAPARVTTGPLLASSVDDIALLDTLVTREAVDLELGPRVDAQTVDGWGFTIAHARTSSGQRIAAMYRFGAWRGYVLVELEGAQASDVEAALRCASPDWRGDREVHCVAELFE